MKEKKVDRIGFTLSNGITFWFPNSFDGIGVMVDMLNRYNEITSEVKNENQKD